MDATHLSKLIRKPCTLVHIQSEKSPQKRWYNVIIMKSVLHEKDICERIYSSIEELSHALDQEALELQDEIDSVIILTEETEGNFVSQLSEKMQTHRRACTNNIIKNLHMFGLAVVHKDIKSFQNLSIHSTSFRAHRGYEGIGPPLIYILDVLDDEKLHSFVNVIIPKDSCQHRILCSCGNRSVNRVNFNFWQKMSVSNHELQEQENLDIL